MAEKTLREELEGAVKLHEGKEAEALKFRKESLDRAIRLRREVDSSSSHESRTWQTLNHLGGKAQGDAADASIRHRENIKESMAEDEVENAERNGKRASAHWSAARAALMAAKKAKK